MTSRQLLLSKADTLTETEVAEVLEYIGIMESLRDRPGRAGVCNETLLVSWAKALVPLDRNRRKRLPGEKHTGSVRV